MKTRSITIDPIIEKNDLSRRWPDKRLSKSFRVLLAIYQKVTDQILDESGQKAESVQQGYETICRWISESFVKSTAPIDFALKNLQEERIAVNALAQSLREEYGQEWLQAVASLLGMLMHFDLDSQHPNALVNHRRPHKHFSTYPTSPAVTRMVGDVIVTHLLKKPIPTICHRSVDAERYAERALDFRIMDPSMESGELLLAVAFSVIRYVHCQHAPGSKSAHRLNRALLEKLCSDCLWGIDQNELAVSAVCLVFLLLGTDLGLENLTPKHIFTADAIEYFTQVESRPFDGIINNPPWGEPLSPTHRKLLRERFTALQYWTDTYVVFSELAVTWLRPGGIFALLLPSHVVAASNTSRLREMLANKTALEQIILLPRQAFANATVRGIVLLGQLQPVSRWDNCQVTVYPLVKRFSSSSSARSFNLPAKSLRVAGKGSWWPLLSSSNFVFPYAQTIQLEHLASVASGVKLYTTGRGTPPQTTQIVKEKAFTLDRQAHDAIPGIRGRDLHEFYMGKPSCFIKFGKWLAYTGNHHAFLHSRRIFVRELCRRDGKLTAAIAKDGVIPLHGILTVIPTAINPYALVSILNSMRAAEYVRTHATSFSKVDFQKVTVKELRQFPIPIAAIAPSCRSALGIDLPTEQDVILYRRLVTLARQLSCAVSTKSSAAAKLRVKVESVVSAMYGLTRR